MYKYILISLLLVFTGSATVGYFYYINNEVRKALLIQEVEQLTAATETQRATISSLQQDYETLQRVYTQLNTDFRSINTQRQLLLDRLGRHDIAALAYARPALITNIVNNASDKALRCFELLSGAPLTEQELNAENAQSFNSECPWLFPN